MPSGSTWASRKAPWRKRPLSGAKSEGPRQVEQRAPSEVGAYLEEEREVRRLGTGEARGGVGGRGCARTPLCPACRPLGFPAGAGAQGR